MRINKIVKYLILADIAFWTGWGLVTPVFAIFIVDRIVGGSALVVGIATAIYWSIRSFLIFPIGRLLDDYRGERDDYLFMVSGSFIASLVPFGYLFATYPWHIYLLQFFYALGLAMSLAGWRAIFTRNIDTTRAAAEWSLDDASLSFGTGIAGLVSGILVTRLGFNFSFIIAGTLGFLSVLLLLFLRRDIQGVFNRRFHRNVREIFDITNKEKR